MDLTAKQQRFINEYLKDCNATRAAIRAGYSEESAQQIGSENLLKPVIAVEIERRQKELADAANIDAGRVIMELKRIAFSDIGRLFREDGTLKQIAEMSADDVAALNSIEVLEEFDGRGELRTKTGETKKVRLWDKLNALEKLGKRLGMFLDVPPVIPAAASGKDDVYKSMTRAELEAIEAIERAARERLGQPG